ncbi:MAG: ABC transporter permease [Rhodanobacteraceae bacterium]
MNNKVVAVVRREFTTRVRTRTFVISTLLLPVLILFIAVVPAMLMSGSDHTMRIAVVDASGVHLGTQVAHVLDAEKLGTGTQAKPRYAIKVFPATGDAKSVRDRLIGETGFSRDDANNAWDGVLVLGAHVLSTGKPTYYGSNVSSMEAMGRLQRSLSQAFAATRLTKAGLDVGMVTQAMSPVDMQASKVSDGKVTGQSGASAFGIAYGMGIILYMSILLFGQRTMLSVIEEKTSRIMEVLVSSLTPFQMLMGKVLGVGAAGLLQMAIWGISAYLITSQGAHLAALLGVNAETLQKFALPTVSASLVAVFLVYFALGFLLYGALYAAIGSMCNSVQDSQQYASVVTMVILVGFFAVFSVISNPSGELGSVMSWIPFFAPFVMPVRWSLASVSALDLAGSLVLMVLGLWVCVWVAARIYHTGILMFGKKPTWRELWRWVRAS